MYMYQLWSGMVSFQKWMIFYLSVSSKGGCFCESVHQLWMIYGGEFPI